DPDREAARPDAGRGAPGRRPGAVPPGRGRRSGRGHVHRGRGGLRRTGAETALEHAVTSMTPLAWLESDMARHMLVEFPLLAALGAGLAQVLAFDLKPVDRYGLTGWTFASLVLAFWMIPAALDAALGSAAMNAVKYASVVAAGFAVRSAMRR